MVLYLKIVCWILIYCGFETLNASASLGAGLSASAEIASGNIGIRFGDSTSIGVRAYIGAGLAFDFTNGIRFGGGYGLCCEIYIEIDWYELFKQRGYENEKN